MNSIVVYAIIIGVISTILYLVYRKLNHTYKYWERKAIKGPQPKWFFGNLDRVFLKKDSIHTMAAKLYEDYPNEKFIGIFQGLTPALILTDPDLIKRVLKMDFGIFVNRGVRATANDPLKKILFLQIGNDWKILRQRLSPLFTSGKLKQMMPILRNCAKEYIAYVDKLVDDNYSQEIHNLNMKFALKVIFSIAFGLEIDTFTDEESIFTQMAKQFLQKSNKKAFVIALSIMFPRFTDFLRLKHTNTEVTKFFFELIKTIVKEREGRSKVRGDFMDCMIELKEQGTVWKDNDGNLHELDINDEIIMGEAIEFYIAGFANTSGTLAFLLHELALNPKIQDRCYDDIKEAMEKTKGQINYDTVQSLQYIGMVFDETLRKYPLVGVLFRESNSEYKFPGLTIDKGTKIIIPVTAIHKDPKYFPDPEEFKPERFALNDTANIRDCTYLPFGDGPRNCIGLRFAKIQTILGIVYFLHKFRVEPSERTVKEIRYDPLQSVLTSIDGIWLNIKRR